ncbi:MAG: acyl-CoA dehydrogenase family protein [Bdellovibrionota bacterium]
MIDFELEQGQKNVLMMAQTFCKTMIRPKALEFDEKHEMDMKFLANLKNLAMGGGGMPKEMGGEGAGLGETPDKKGVKQTNRLMALVTEEIGWADPAVTLNVPGPGVGGPPVAMMGTDEQRKKYLSIFGGKDPKWGAYALTEPGCGSDAAAIQTTCRKDGDYYVLNGQKMFCSNGARAEWTVVFATIDKSKGKAGHRVFVVEKGTPGFQVLKIEKKMGMRASETAALAFEDCRVHKDQLLGGEKRYETGGSEGFKVAMKTFDTTRFMVGLLGVGIGRAAYEIARDTAKEMYLLSRPINRYQSIRDTLSNMERKLNAGRLLGWNAAYMADMGIPNSMESSMAKAYGAKVGKECCREAMSIVGNHSTERKRLLEKAFRDIPIFDIFEGTGQIQRLVISRRLMDGLDIQ